MDQTEKPKQRHPTRKQKVLIHAYCLTCGERRILRVEDVNNITELCSKCETPLTLRKKIEGRSRR